jgi:glycine betaine/choline ABC-type transport system substrate-binding protein
MEQKSRKKLKKGGTRYFDTRRQAMKAFRKDYDIKVKSLRTIIVLVNGKSTSNELINSVQ